MAAHAVDSAASLSAEHTVLHTHYCLARSLLWSLSSFGCCERSATVKPSVQSQCAECALSHWRPQLCSQARLKAASAAALELEATRARIDAAELRARELERAHAAVEVQRDEAVALRVQLEARIAEMRAASSATESDLASTLQVRSAHSAATAVSVQ